MKILVQRQPTLNPGPDIIEPMLGTIPGAIERGRAAIEEAAAGDRVRQKVVYRDGERPGNLIEVSDASQGANWKGIVTALTIDGEGAKATVTQEVRRAGAD